MNKTITKIRACQGFKTRGSFKILIRQSTKCQVLSVTSLFHHAMILLND